METLKILHEHFLSSTGVCTDTRNIKKDCVFFALKGANFDGNKFYVSALEQGSKICVVDDANLRNEKGCFWVDDVLKTLQNLANYHREYLKIPILALTGSNGKTTTKELIATVLSSKFNISFTQGNLNNHIGVPLTILNFLKEHEFGIVEMGANHQKEIAFLCEIAQPNYGLITNIGSAHLEGFGGLEGVRKGKTEMYQYLTDNDRVIFINELENSLNPSVPNYSKSYFYGKEKPQFVQYLKDDLGRLKFEVVINNKNYTVATQLFGEYNIHNVITSIAIGLYFDINPEIIIDRIKDYIPSNNRSQIKNTSKKNQLILDAYNANPTSMINALQQFVKIGSEKFFVLGDMFELGSTSKSEHQKIIDFAKENKLSGVFIGKQFNNLLKNQQIPSFETVTEAIDFFRKNPIVKNTVLLKGSRGIGLEKLEDLF